MAASAPVVVRAGPPPAAPVAVVASRVVVPDVAITRSVYNAPGTTLDNLDAWNYAFEADNGIKQEAVGEMKQASHTHKAQ